MKGKRILVWFKTNLRLLDNEALVAACEKASAVFPVYIIDDRMFQTQALGFPKTGAFRTRFLLESLHDLQSSLRQHEAGLLVFRGRPEEIIPRLALELKVSAVYAEREVTDEELRIQNQVEQRCEAKGIAMRLFWQHTLYHLEDIPWPIQHLPDTFTHFRKEAEQEAIIRPALPIPVSIPFTNEIGSEAIPTLQQLGFSEPEQDPRAAIHFHGGESQALARMKEYIWEKDRLKIYKETRNELLGADYSSKFSPWLSLGCISPKTIYEEVRRYERERVKNDSTYWLIFELMWRDYFRFAAKKYGNRIFQLNGLGKKNMTLKEDRDTFEQWRQGETNIPFIDANMKELLHSGFMSNRGRQNVASVLVKDLKINWTWGAAWFESQLIDYDPTSNWLNWAYVAGVGNDPREDRYFNTESQVRKYDPHGHYMDHWLATNKA